MVEFPNCPPPQLGSPSLADPDPTGSDRKVHGEALGPFPQDTARENPTGSDLGCLVTGFVETLDRDWVAPPGVSDDMRHDGPQGDRPSGRARWSESSRNLYVPEVEAIQDDAGPGRGS